MDASEAPHKVGHSLTQKVGPFPVWVWGVGVGGLAVLFMFLHNNSGDTVDATGDAVGTDYTTADSAMNANDASLSGLYTGGGGTGDAYSNTGGASTVDPASVGNSPFKNNAQWLRAGVAYLVTAGYPNALASQNALSKYLKGQKITEAQANRVNKVIVKYGPPPQTPKTVSPIISSGSGSSGSGSSSGGSSSGGNGTTPTGGLSSDGKTYVVTGHNDRYPAQICKIAWNIETAKARNAIIAANPTKTVPYPVGSKIHIPTKPKTTGGTHAAPTPVSTNPTPSAGTAATITSPVTQQPIRVVTDSTPTWNDVEGVATGGTRYPTGTVFEDTTPRYNDVEGVPTGGTRNPR